MTAKVYPCKNPEEIVSLIREIEETKDKNVLSFVGYSGRGYKDEKEMMALAERLLDDYDPAKTIINIGATAAGIGAVYELAKRKKFTTIGIVSVLAKQYDCSFSPFVDFVYCVEDKQWGGYIEANINDNTITKTTTKITTEASEATETSRETTIAALTTTAEITPPSSKKRTATAALSLPILNSKSAKTGIESPETNSPLTLLSPTSQAIVNISDVIIAIGGGIIADSEIQVAECYSEKIIKKFQAESFR